MDPVQQFVHSFHEVEGYTLGERSRNINLLLKDFVKNNKLSEVDIQRLDTILRPQDITEEAFKLDVLLYLRNKRALFQIFEGENLKLIGRLAKSKWFFREAFHNIKGADLANFFKRISPNARAKIIFKLAAHLQDEQIAQDYYATIKKIYGFKMAMTLLPACSLKFIRNLLRNQFVRFTDKQLLKILMKDYRFAVVYFLHNIKKTSPYIYGDDYAKSLHYIATKDCHLFAKLIEEGIHMKLNEKLTKKLYEVKKDDIIARPISYLNFLHWKTIRYILGDDFYAFYKNTFPESVKDFPGIMYYYKPEKYFTSHSTLFLLDHLPKLEKYNTIVNAFHDVYNLNIFDYPQNIKIDFIKIMPVEERIKWAKIKLEDKDEWMCYLEINDAIDKIKGKINLTSNTDDRYTYTTYLIDACKINDCQEKLLDVLKYYYQRHCNEDGYYRKQFLRHLSSQYQLKKFDKSYWVEILKILKLLKIKKDSYFETRLYLAQYLEYLVDTNQITDEDVIMFIEEGDIFNYVSHEYSTSNFRKHLILKFPELVLNRYQNGKERFKICLSFINEINNWNRYNPQDKINRYQFSDVIEILLNTKDEDDWKKPIEHVVSNLLDCKSNDPQNLIIIERFWDTIGEHIFTYRDILPVALKTLPKSFADNTHKLEAASHYSLSDCLPFFKCYAHLGIPQKLKEIFLARLKETHNEFFIEALVHLMPTQEYIASMSHYHVENTKIDLNEDDSIYNRRVAFVSSLKYADQLSLTIPILEKSCAGDYLKPSLDTLYHVVEYTPMPKTEDFLKVLSDRAVSVRKHYIYLIANTRDEATIYNILKALGANEKNPSLLKFIFKRTFKHFCVNPSDEFFELLNLNAHHINKEDEEAYAYFKEIDCIPPDYLPRFIVLAWECMSQSELKSVQNDRFRLLNKVTKDMIKKLPDTFCRKIIKTFFCRTNEYCIMGFCLHYILARDDDANLRFVCQLLRDFLSQYKKRPNQMITSMLHSMCDGFRMNNLIDYLRTFADVWYEFFGVIKAFEVHLLLQFNILYLMAGNENKCRSFAEKVSQFFTENIEKYGCMIIAVFAEALGNCSRFSYEYGIMDFYKDLLEFNSTPYHCYLVLLNLPSKDSLNNEDKLKYETVLDIVNACNDDWFQILLYNRMERDNDDDK